MLGKFGGLRWGGGIVVGVRFVVAFRLPYGQAGMMVVVLGVGRGGVKFGAVQGIGRGQRRLRSWIGCVARPAIPVPIGHDRAAEAPGVSGRQGGSWGRFRQE